MKRIAVLSALIFGTYLAVFKTVDMAKEKIVNSVPDHVEERFIEAFGHKTTQGLIDTNCAKALWYASETEVWTDPYCYRTYNHLLEKL